MAANDQLITLRKAKATVVAANGVSVSQWLVRMVLKTLGYSRENVQCHERPSSIEIATTVSRNVAIDLRQSEVGLFFYSMRLALDETVGAYMGTRRSGRLLNVRLNSRRMTTPSSVLAGLNSFYGLGFARREDSYNSAHYVQSLKTFP